MNSEVAPTVAKADAQDVSQRARRRVAYRLLPFVFLLYIINYIDRVNVSLANLRMSADLGFSDRVHGLGVGIFYVTYVFVRNTGSDHRRTLERSEMDCPDYDLVARSMHLDAVPSVMEALITKALEGKIQHIKFFWECAERLGVFEAPHRSA